MQQLFRCSGVCALLLSSAAAQFGVPNKRQKHQQQGGGASSSVASVDAATGDAAVLDDMLNDPELAEAFEMLSDMSPGEIEDTLRELSTMLGDDDPETGAALREAVGEVSEMSSGEIRASLDRIVEAERSGVDRDVSDAVTETLKMLKDTDANMIDTILEEREAILEAVVRGGQISEEDAERYRRNPAEWEKELKGIWGELRRQADESL